MIIHSIQLIKKLLNMKYKFYGQDLSREWKHTIKLREIEGLGYWDALRGQAQVIADDFGVPIQNICIMNQTHSSVAKDVSNPVRELIDGDALITKKPNMILVVIHADCVPVLLYDEECQMVAGIHSGWKGTLSGVVQSTVEQMVRCGVTASNIRAIIGPCIRQSSYEVGCDVYDRFVDYNSHYKRFFLKDDNKQDKYWFDLPGCVKFILADSGVNSIDDCMVNTYDSDDYYSYRLACHSNAPKKLMNLSAISLR